MEDTDRIIHKIYEAANEHEYWDELNRELVDRLDGGSIHLLLASLETGAEYVNLFARGDPEFATEYLRDYAGIDFRVPRVMARGLGEFSDEREYVSQEQARQSPIHQDLLPRYDVHHISGANMSLNGCIGWFGISTRSPSEEFDGRQRAILSHLTPHILNALRITRTHSELKLTRDLHSRSLDFVNAGLFLFQQGELVYTNEYAQLLVKNGPFLLHNGNLSCAQPSKAAKLAAFMKGSIGRHADGETLLRVEDSGAAYLVRMHHLTPPLFEGASNRKSSFMVSITELALPAAPDLEEVMRFCAGFEVSRAEEIAVQASLNSTSLATLAAARGVSLDTVRQQLKSAMAKMGLNSQRKLIQAFERFRTMGSATTSSS